MRRQAWRALGSVSLGIASLAIAVAASAPAQAQKRGGTLHSYIPDNPPSASPQEESTIYVAMPFSAVFNNLVFPDPKAKKDALDTLKPELAESWAWSEDGTQLTFKLRQGVKWHDGKPFSSADVKCTFDIARGAVDGKWRKNPRKSWYANVKDITTNGPNEVTFVLQRPQPSLLMMLGTAFTAVYPCHVDARTMRTKPIGTGPFKVDEIRQNELVRLVRNPDYWRPSLPYLDAIEYAVIPSRATAVLAFIAGKVELTNPSQITPPVLKDIKAQAPNAVCDFYQSNGQTNLLVNRDKPPFDNADVRRAMNLSIDRPAFIQSLQDGEGNLGGAALSPPGGQWGMPPEMLSTVPGYGTNIEKSRAEGRKLMSALGYSAEKPLKIKLTTRNSALYRDPAVLLIDHFRSIFIEAELEVLDSSVWYTRMSRKDYQVAMNGQGNTVDDPDVYFYESFACGSERNYTQYCNPELQKLFDKQSAMTDVAKRRELVWQIDKMLQEDGARPVISQSKAAQCWQPYVKNIYTAVNGYYNHWRFDEVWLDK